MNLLLRPIAGAGATHPDNRPRFTFEDIYLDDDTDDDELIPIIVAIHERSHV